MGLIQVEHLQIKYLGHSGVLLKGDGHTVVIDPFITGNPKAGASLAELHPDAIVVTHAHGDHWGDTPELAKRSGAVVVATAEIAQYSGALGLKAAAMNIGGSRAFEFGRVTLTQAFHSSSFPDGTYGGMPTGVVIEFAGKRIYHAGDTALFSDMSLIARQPLDIAFLPIGDNYTMGPEDALEAVRLLNPKTVIPVHYATFPEIAQDALAFKAAVESATSSVCVVLAPGEEVRL